VNQERIDLISKIERCRRLARDLTDDEMRGALEHLAEHYEAQLERRDGGSFMLRK
jgi:hypothetical protein